MSTASTPRARLTTRERSLIVLGVLAWVALGFGGAWLYHQLTRPPAECGTALEARSTSPKTATTSGGPRNALQLLTGTGHCS